MTSTWNIFDLEIIGYADSRGKTLLPAIVPPVFRSITNSRIILVPPYTLETEAVIGATRISMDEAEHLQAEGKVTLLLANPRRAQPGFQLWISRGGNLIYQPIRETREALDRLSEEAVLRATKELYLGNLDLAEEAASEAVLSNDRRIEPNAMKAAIRRRRGNVSGERLMAELARPLMEGSAFRALVDHYCAGTPLVAARDVSTRTRGPMDDVAKELPRPV